MLRPLLAVLLLVVPRATAQSAGVVRHDFLVPEEGGIRIFVREVVTNEPAKDAPAILLIHGARVPG